MLAKRKLLLSICILSACLLSCKRETEITKIAFGSCGHQDEPQPVLALAAEQQPAAFIFLGDNIYGDTDNMDTLRNKYTRWMAQPDFKKLYSSTTLFATWDDHDFGRNDAGKWYPYKKESKEIFMESFKEPANSERRKHDGIYKTEYIQQGEKTIQVILLDVRTFRSDVLLYDSAAKLPRDHYFYTPDYKPHVSTDSTLLGEEQWRWLEEELKKPADLRLICSGSQFAIEYNGYEAWANFPHEQKRMLELIKSAKASGVLFLTGDVHYAEISRLEEPGLYPLYDITASGITSTWDFATQNKNRIEGPVMDNHYGLLTIEWAKDPVITMEIIDKFKNTRIEYTINKSQIQF
ncbi:MAG TPA: alkaline phosphatase D family protein [Chitinophagaceae bacterium]|nr:alkaline phosphatase D family protein [Chitinophagaceae bacterium]HNU14116.1 alkaline phosphatase D family protein [Chitinophagaceae bacterium]